MLNLPAISIITPSYNQAHFLETAVQSVINQNYPKLEYLLMDGGSTDGSVEIIRRHASRLAYWVSQPDGGQSNALNEGFRRATGDVVGWLNSDDLYTRGTLETVALYFARHPEVIMVYGDCYVIDRDGQVLKRLRPGSFDLVRLLYRDYVMQMTVFFRREMLERLGGFDPQFKYALDYDLWLRAGLIFPSRIKYLPRTLACYRVHEGSGSISAVVPALFDEIAVREKFIALPDLSQEILAVSGDVFLDPLRRLFLAASNKASQSTVFCYLRSVLGDNALAAQEWTSLGEFLAGITVGDSDVRIGAHAALKLLRLWRVYHSIPSVTQRERSETAWMAQLMVRLAYHHLLNGYTPRAAQLIGLAVKRYPVILVTVVNWTTVEYMARALLDRRSFQLLRRWKRLFRAWRYPKLD